MDEMNAATRLWCRWFEPVEHTYPEPRLRTVTNTTRERERRLKQAARARARRDTRQTFSAIEVSVAGIPYREVDQITYTPVGER